MSYRFSFEAELPLLLLGYYLFAASVGGTSDAINPQSIPSSLVLSLVNQIRESQIAQTYLENWTFTDRYGS